MRKPLPPEIVEKHRDTPFITTYTGSEGEVSYIPNLLNINQMPDDVFLDLCGRVRTRPWQPGDGRPMYSPPEGMRPWVRRDIANSESDGWFFVDKRIEPSIEPWFDLAAVLFMHPAHWPPALRNRYPGAIPTSGFLPARL